jgi:pyruvate dehydrogenase E1 component beta subunit
VCPTTPQDARDMLVAAIGHLDPVIFMEPKRIYRARREEVSDHPPFDIGDSDGRATELLSSARVARDGDGLAVMSYGATLPLCLEAAERLSEEDAVEARVLDLRSLYPLDVAAITEAASACGRALVVHEAPRAAGIGAEVSSLVHERCMLDLEAPVGRVTGYDVPFPQFANEDDYLPSVARILAGARKVLEF